MLAALPAPLARIAAGITCHVGKHGRIAAFAVSLGLLSWSSLENNIAANPLAP
ncbi:hypothetical protein KSF73_12500 [Burkholderiaceae bacterium DAT-1]|nr:hypothetical protein [Burkholderiaceae bacterium DAT-1]